MGDDPRDVFDEADKNDSGFPSEGPSTAVYLHQVKSELDNDWYGKDHKTERIGAYRIKDKLGEGGMAQVYRAYQMSTDREVAVKVVSLKGGTRNDMAQQVFREASALAMIDHPNVISCFGFGEDKGRMYMALEILHGKDSNDLIVDNGNRPFTMQKLFDISMQAVSGFEMVYKAGFIHRDIKPANIFVNDDGVVKVADLGLAWKGADVSLENVKSGALGTPSYMSPEQIIDEVELDVRSDLYSMGATIFFYATGRTPFIGEDPMAVMRQALVDPPPDMREFNAEVPEGLVLIVNKAMQKDREMRYKNWRELFEDLKSVSTGSAPTHADVVNEMQQMLQKQGAFAAEKSGTGTGLIIGIFVAVVIAIVAYVVVINGAEKVVKDPEIVPIDFASLQEEISIFDIKGMSAKGNASIHADYLSLNGGILEASQTESLIKGLKAADEFSVELVLTSANDTQDGPARIVTFSNTYAARNFTIAQSKDAYEIRVRTSTALSGLRPRFVVGGVVKPNQEQHLLFVREGEFHTLYIDGVEVFQTEVFGTISNWDEGFPLLLGNDIKKSAPWTGTVHCLKFIHKPFSADEARLRYETWQQSKKK